MYQIAALCFNCLSIQRSKLLQKGTGNKLKGAFTLAHMKGLPKGTGKEWLLMKKKDAHALPYFAIKTELTPARLAKLKEKTPPCETE